jgi:hypothetical protein
MRRWAWRILVTWSTLLLIATAGLWARSRHVTDYVDARLWQGDPRGSPTRTLIGITCRQGPVFHYVSVHFRVNDDAAAALTRDLAAGPRWRRFAFAPRDYLPVANGSDYDTFVSRTGGGFTWQAGDRGERPTVNWGQQLAGSTYWYGRISHLTLAVPWWSLVAAFALVPLRAVWNWQRRHRRRPPQACPACGYDLRTTADAAGPRWPTCPECGRQTAA